MNFKLYNIFARNRVNERDSEHEVSRVDERERVKK